MRTAMILVAAASALLHGCGSSPAPEPPPPQSTVLDPMLQQMERAKQRAAEMERRKQQLDVQLESQER